MQQSRYEGVPKKQHWQ